MKKKLGNYTTCEGMLILDGVVFHCLLKRRHRKTHYTHHANGGSFAWQKPTVKYLYAAGLSLES